MTDTESESETESDAGERKMLESNLRKTALAFEDSLAAVDGMIYELQKIHTQLAASEADTAPIQKDMFVGKYEIRKTVPEIKVIAGDKISYKELVGRIIDWIEAEGMEKDGMIKPTAAFSAAFELKKKTVKFPEILGRLKKLII
jgi:hypothetical protein